MMRAVALGHRLPRPLSAALFGDRRRFGLVPVAGDPDWIAWQEFCYAFYDDTQRRGVGRIVNDAGFRAMAAVDLSGAHVLEVGPGSMPHVPYWRGRPAKFTIVDVRQQMIDRAADVLERLGVEVDAHCVTGGMLPIEAGSIDIALTFFTLEHIHPLSAHAMDLERVLKPGGLVVGAIPTEGGLAWGVGRFLTSRRYFKQRLGINHNKIVCWEHPNFADAVLDELDRRFDRVRVSYWPAILPLLDANLVVRFVYRKR